MTSPGPWQAEFTDLSERAVAGDESTRGRMVMGIYSMPKDGPATYVVIPWKWAENLTALIARDEDVRLVLAAPDYHEAARAFVAHYRTESGCSHCGGMPHSPSCFVGRFEAVMAKVQG